MAENFTIEAPNVDEIRKGNKQATADGVDLLWQALNAVDKAMRRGVRFAIERAEKKTLVTELSANANNFDSQSSTILRFDGAAAFNLTGIRERPEGTFLFVMVLGAGTLTLKHESANSEDINRLFFASGADKAVTTGKSVILNYQSGRWRDLDLV